MVAEEIYALDLDWDLIMHLADPDSVAFLRSERLSPEIIEDELAERVYKWQMWHLREHGKPATGTVIEDEFPDVELSEPQSAIGDLVKRLRDRYSRNESRQALRDIAKLASEEPGAVGAEMLRLGKKLTDLSSARGDQFGTGDFDRAVEVYNKKVLRGPGPTLGFEELDAHFNGLQGITVLVAPPKSYKALALDTPIPTPTGWTTMGRLAIGDRVFDENGIRCSVISKSDIFYGRPCFKVHFSDGTNLVADADHLWQTYCRDKGIGVRTTQEIKDTLLRTDHGFNHSIEVASPLECPEADLPIDPYVLGVWLGDGTSREGAITTFDQGVTDKIEGFGYNLSRWSSNHHVFTIAGLKPLLRDRNLLNNKHIPHSYLRGSEGQRLELLRGLLDSDGHCTSTGDTVFVTTLPAMRDGCMELVRSLGYKPTANEYQASYDGKDCGPKWHISFCAHSDRAVFTLESKRSRQRVAPKVRARSRSRQIVEVEPVKPVPTQCITVDSPHHLYLAGEAMIPTHNSWFGVNKVVEGVIKGEHPKLYSLELPAEDTYWRCACMIGNVPYWKYERGAIDPEDMNRINEAIGMLDESGVFDIEKPPPGERSAQVLVERAIAEGADSIIIDQLQYVENETGTNLGALNDTGYYWQVLSMLRDYSDEVPIFIIHQFNRSVMNAKEMPEMQQAKGSAAIEETAHLALGLWANKDMRKNNVIEVGTLASRSYSYKNWHLEVGLSKDCRLDMIGEVTDDEEE